MKVILVFLFFATITLAYPEVPKEPSKVVEATVGSATAAGAGLPKPPDAGALVAEHTAKAEGITGGVGKPKAGEPTKPGASTEKAKSPVPELPVPLPVPVPAVPVPVPAVPVPVPAVPSLF